MAEGDKDAAVSEDDSDTHKKIRHTKLSALEERIKKEEQDKLDKKFVDGFEIIINLSGLRG